MASKHLLLLLPAILGLVIPRTAATVGTNYLLTGETLNTNEHLRNGDFDLVMQEDCNLVLYNGNWQSNTANRGKECKLTLTDRGELLIQDRDGSNVWSSGSQSERGNYAAVLHPEGRLVIYGPSVFKINPWAPRLNSLLLGDVPFTNNMLFSGQILHNDGMLTARNHRLVMQEDCNLVLYGGKLGWQSNTHGNGEHCFLRLTHKGELIIKDDDFKTIWSSRSKSKQGDYAFILQDDGFAVIYGPAIFSTGSKSSVAAEEMMIGMVTEKVNAK
uniref:Mannose-binding tuber lectin n=1 Tax=Typhonium divaricatum TaxID=239688 RepID=A2ICN3_9ARAE|nr:mannose-binding tuber lectin [Typhonium divaricatum]